MLELVPEEKGEVVQKGLLRVVGGGGDIPQHLALRSRMTAEIIRRRVVQGAAGRARARSHARMSGDYAASCFRAWVWIFCSCAPERTLWMREWKEKELWPYSAASVEP